jgi:hypothetical protein
VVVSGRGLVVGGKGIMKIGRMLAGAGALTAMGLLIAPGVASAHNASANPSCSGLSVSVALYPDTVTTTITIDGTPQVRDGNGMWVIDWSDTASHTWSVFVDNHGLGFDFRDSGTQQACVTTTTTTEPPTTTTEPPPTTLPPVTTEHFQVSTTTTEPATTTSTTTTQPGSTTPTTNSSSGGGSSSQSGSLPRTGPTTGPLIGAGAAALVAGGALCFVARRGRSVS